MNLLQSLRRLWAHCLWADRAVLEALDAGPDTAAAWREYAHVLGAEALWLARLEQRSPSVPVWPRLSRVEAEALRREVAGGYDAYLARLDGDALPRTVEYTNSAGQTFRTPVGDILLHVMLHGQYHRGKINLLLRQHLAAPAPVDYIGFVRGVPAAVTNLEESL